MAEEGHPSSSRNLPRRVEEVFADYDGRRRGILNALLQEVEDFCQQCRPDNGSLLGLYAFPDQSWKLLRREDLEKNGDNNRYPPVFGINTWRDKMSKEDWITHVAIHSDAWLVSVAAHFAGRSRFHENDSKKLWRLVNGVPTVVESFTEAKRPKSTSTEDQEASCVACCFCERFYHGDCVNIPLLMIHQGLQEFICPSCGNKRRRRTN